MKINVLVITLLTLASCSLVHALPGCTSPQGKKYLQLRKRANLERKTSNQFSISGSQANFQQRMPVYNTFPANTQSSFKKAQASSFTPSRIRGVRWAGVGAGALGAAGGAYLLYKKDQNIINNVGASFVDQPMADTRLPESILQTSQENLPSSTVSQPTPQRWYQQGVTKQQRTIEKLKSPFTQGRTKTIWELERDALKLRTLQQEQ